VPWVSDGQADGSTARTVGDIRPVHFSLRKGNIRPPKFDPPPVQPTSRSGVSPTLASWSSVSSPMTVWCISTWFSTLPSA
jgi:hypothetical protein